MKKLMFAMAIAATVGFAQAEIGTTSTFDQNGFSDGDAFSTDNLIDTQWTNNTGSEGPVDATVKAYDTVGDNGANYLQLDGVQNLAKKIGNNGTEIGKGLYIDTMVKFTATEEDGAPTPGEGDKLVVWLKQTGDGDNATYTLMVTAGYIDTEHEELSTKSYETTASVQPDTWYNLKVKAIENVDTIEATDGTPGFVVFINGTAVVTAECPADLAEFFGTTKYVDEGNDSYSIFPSMVGGLADNGTTITQLAFTGSGAIDTVGAFQGDCDPDYEVTYTGAANATVVTDPADTTALAAGATVDFTVTPAENYEYATTPTGWTAGANGAITMTYTVVAGENVVTIPAPTAKSVEPTEDWVDPTDADAIAAIAGKQAAEAYPSLAGTAVAAVDAKKLTIWATGTGNVDFSDAATDINTTAFLLNIANSSSAADIEAAEAVAKEAIKITAISFDANGDVVLTIPDPATYGNGKIVVEGSAQLPAVWHDKVDTDKFFRTKLVLDEVAAPAVGD